MLIRDYVRVLRGSSLYFARGDLRFTAGAIEERDLRRDCL